MSFLRCDTCDVPLYDDPHWDDVGMTSVCDACCTAPSCNPPPGGRSVPDSTAGPATGDAGAAIHGAAVPAAGGLL